MTKEPTSMATPELVDHIKQLQGIQKTHAPTTPAWQTASELLSPCFAEMQRRSDAGELAGMTIRL